MWQERSPFGSSESDLLPRRLRILLSGVGVIFGGLAVRLVDLQVMRGTQFRSLAEQNRTHVLTERAPRGRIMDRSGRILADRRFSFVLLFSPLGLEPGQAADTVARLPHLLGGSSRDDEGVADQAQVRDRLETAIRQKVLVRVWEDLPRPLAFRLLEGRHRLPGVTLLLEGKRAYPERMQACHILGYTGEISPEELTQLATGFGGERWPWYRRGTRIGKAGVERGYDSWLRGREGGVLVEVNARGHHQRVVRHIRTAPGYDLELTLDRSVQAAAEAGLSAMHRAGAVVALDPQSGRILALASAPGFDPNVFVDPAAMRERQALLSDPDRPLFNRAVQGTYPPGSVFKLVTSWAGLETGKVRPEERLECQGALVLGRDERRFRCWEMRGHGALAFREAVARSCDVYFYHIGLRVGPDLLEATAQRCGFGQPTGVDLIAERKGLVPGRTWKQRRGEGWYDGNTLNYAIGQGDLVVTPIQLAVFTALLANRGTVWQPYVVEAVRDHEGQVRYRTAPRAVTVFPPDLRLWDLIHRAMEQTVAEGTGRASGIPGVRVAGKTGTAQNPHGPDHGLFVAFAPIERPRIACAIVVEHGEHGATTAAPIARALIASALGVSTGTLHGLTGTVYGD